MKLTLEQSITAIRHQQLRGRFVLNRKGKPMRQHRLKPTAAGVRHRENVQAALNMRKETARLRAEQQQVSHGWSPRDVMKELGNYPFFKPVPRHPPVLNIKKD